MRQNKRLWMFAIVFICLCYLITGDPGGVKVGDINSSRYASDAEVSIGARGGNVTYLVMNVTGVSNTWSAYYGNINGTLTLANSENRSIYNWKLDNPYGEVYMSNETIDFSDISCWNNTRFDDGYFNLTDFEDWLGIDYDSEDGVNETFSGIGEGIHDAFYVGRTYIEENSCPATNMYNASGQKQTDKYQEMLLYDNNKGNIIYTSLIESNTVGFNGKIIDFEMIVGDKDSDDVPTEYFVYVELG